MTVDGNSQTLRPETASHQKSKMMIHEDAEQLLVHLNNQHLGHRFWQNH